MTRNLKATLGLAPLVLGALLAFAPSASAEVLWGNQQLTSFGTGGAVGGFADYPGAAVSPANGDLYVADTGDHRVEVFSSAGKFIAAWGWGVKNGEHLYQVCTHTCENGISGAGTGQMEAPLAVAVDGTTNDVYVVDADASRIDEFSGAGKPIRKFGRSGNGKSEMSNPAGGFAYDQVSNELLLADTGNERIEAFTPSGGFAGTFGAYGTGDDEFSTPIGVAAARNGDIYVADSGNNRIEQFSPRKKFVAAWGVGVRDGMNETETCTASCLPGIQSSLDGGFYAPGGLAVDPTDGSVYVADYLNDQVQRFTAAGQYQSQFHLLTPNLLALDPRDGDIYITESSYVVKYSAGGGFLAAFGGGGATAGQHDQPHGVAVNSNNGDVYVADYDNHRVDVLSSSGRFLGAWGWGVKDGVAQAEVCTTSCQAGISGDKRGALEGPLGVAVDPSSGAVFVSDYLADQIQEFSSAGAPEQILGGPGSGAAEFQKPQGLAYDPALSELFVADSGNNRIDILNFGTSTGSAPAMFGWGVDGTPGAFETCPFNGSCVAGDSGAGAGEFSGPTGVAVTPSGTIYVADHANNRVDVFTDTSEPVFDSAWGSGVSNGTAGAEVCTSSCRVGLAGTGPGEFNNPQAVTTDPNDGSVYVSDFNNGRIEELSATGAYISDFGSAGTSADQFLDGAAGVAVEPSGALVAVDYQGNKILEFGLPPTPKCKTHTVADKNGRSVTIRLSCSATAGYQPYYALTSKPGHGNLSGFNASTGTVTYKPKLHYKGHDSFKFQAYDDSGATQAEKLSITVR